MQKPRNLPAFCIRITAHFNELMFKFPVPKTGNTKLHIRSYFQENREFVKLTGIAFTPPKKVVESWL